MIRLALLLSLLWFPAVATAAADAPVAREAPVASSPFTRPVGEDDRAGHGAEPPQLAAPRPAIVTGEFSTKRFRILHTERTRGAAENLAERLEAERDAFAKILGRDWPGTTEVRLGAGREELERLALPGGRPPTWAIALAYPSHGIILLDALQLSSAEGPTTLRHELAHVALGGLGEGWPRWFQEGLAQHLTGERLSIGHYTTLFNAVGADRILSFEDLTRGWPAHAGEVQLAYAQSAAFVAWLSERYGGEGLAALLEHVSKGDDFSLAFAKAFHTSIRMEEHAWQETLPERYGWMPWVTTGSLVLGLAALITIFGYIRRRRQLRARLAEMTVEDEVEDEERRLLEAELLDLERQLHDADAEAESDEYALPAREHGSEDDELPRRGKDVLH